MVRPQSKPDWSEDHWREMLVYQRQMFWREDTLANLVKWLDLRPGMTAVDVGCGLGYLGYTFWQHFGKGGRYLGIDSTKPLLRDAKAAATTWAIGGDASFHAGDAYALPLSDNFADWAMCQTLLIHLDQPARAVAEMYRILKPGGLMTCFEPDNVNPALGRLYNSCPQPSIEEQLLFSKVRLICLQGRIELGHGDDSIGPKVPHLLKQQGFVDVDVRCNDQVHFIEPPYDSPLQRRALEKVSKQWGDKEAFRRFREREREQFLAGGGESSEFKRYLEISERYMDAFRRQLDRREYYACSFGAFYVTKGRKQGSA